jgi:hypothetical protein
MEEKGHRPTYLEIFGDLEHQDLLTMNYCITFPYVTHQKYQILEKALLDGHSPHELYLALHEIGALHFDHRKPTNHRKCLNILIAHAPITQHQLDAIFDDWLAYPSDLLGNEYPMFTDSFTVSMVKRGLSLVRDVQGVLRPLAQIEAIGKSTEQVESFFLSALFSDDLEALEHLQQSATLRTLFTDSDCSNAVDVVIHYERDVSEAWKPYYEGYKRFPGVQAKYYQQRPLRDYWLQITGAISEGSMSELERVFEPKFSPRLGGDAVLELVSDSTLITPEKQSVSKAFLVKHILAGADCSRAYRRLVHGRIEALDFLDLPIMLDEVVELAFKRDVASSWVFQVFLAMFTTEEILAHDRGQECLVLLHQITNDQSYLQLIDSLQYRGKAFAGDLGL